jgi:peptide deformylase
MAIREIVQLGDPRLRMVCAPVQDPWSPTLADTIRDLADTLAHWHATTGYGRGIAAPQIGVLERIVYLRVDPVGPLINPSIVARSDTMMTVWDGCLSFLSVFCRVPRHTWVVLRYQDRASAWQELRAEGDLSELVQHEVDHLDGILTVDRMTDIRTLCTREEFERRYRGR